MDDGVKFEKSKEKGKKYLAILPDGQHVNSEPWATSITETATR